MAKELPDSALEAADAAVVFAQEVRRMHARRSGRDSKQRKSDIDLALRRLRSAMKPLKSAIGRFQYGAATEEAEAKRERIRQASAAIQRERRKLWKMSSRSKRKTT